MNNSAKPETLIRVDGLRKYYPITRGLIFQKVSSWVRAVDDISFAVNRRQTFGLVGESGCGKSTTANLILRLESPTGGQIIYKGTEITDWTPGQLHEYRRRVQAVFQDPFRALNPRMKIKEIMAEPLIVHKCGSRGQVMKRVDELLDIVGLNSQHANLYPHEFSGGQRQRVAIARALALKPECIILDEPVSALDVSIQAQILNLLVDLQRHFGLSYLLISHDLAVVEHISTWIGVMYMGTLVEMAEREEFYSKPMHPYSIALLNSVPVADPEIAFSPSIEGEVSYAQNQPSGCNFCIRCPEANSECYKERPGLFEISKDHFVACCLYRKCKL
jgi:oligopeptide/dipeptide ABC transporter ATP-binding protein